jgi:hypothetical protein
LNKLDSLQIELGILIYIFLGWQYVIAELLGGILLIAIVSLIARITMPKKWIDEARDYVEDNEQDEFDWKKKIRTKQG